MTPEQRRLFSAHLARVSTFAGLAENEIHALLGVAGSRVYPSRRTVVRQGEAATSFFLIASGRLKVVRAGRDGRAATVNIMGPGEVFGEVALLDGQARSASVATLEASELLIIDREAFLAFLEQSPAIAVKLLIVLARRVRHLTEQLEATSLDVEQRLARGLRDVALRHGTRLDSGEIQIDLHLTQQDIATLAGTTRETVNRVLREWSSQGVIKLENGRLAACDPAALATLAGEYVPAEAEHP